MIFREAQTTDIKQIQVLRNTVKENRLSNPGLVTDKDCAAYLTLRGKGWVCEMDDIIVAFAIADLIDNNIWALFVHPDYDKKGIGKCLHNMMLDWYFAQQKEMVWLSTSPNTRAEKFYRLQGWRQAGQYGNGEIKFEMKEAEWTEQQLARVYCIKKGILAKEVKLKNKCSQQKYLIIKITPTNFQALRRGIGAYNHANSNTKHERVNANQMEQASINHQRAMQCRN
jgi:GNAT superfamily N-acetyltransferase